MRHLLLFALAFGVAAAAHGQEQGAEDWIRPEAVPARAEALLSEVEAARRELAKQEEFGKIEGDLTKLAPRLDALLARVGAALAASAPLDELEDLTRELTPEAPSLKGWHEALEAETSRVAAQLEQLAQAKALWSATSSRSETAAAGELVAQRIRASLDLVREESALLRAWHDRVLALDNRVVEHHTVVASTLARLEEAATALRTTLLVPDRDPLWRSGFADALGEELPRISETFGSVAARNREYVLSDPRPLIAQMLLAALFALALVQADRKARRRAATAPELADATRVLERPMSIGLLLALIATPWLHPLAPRRFTQTLGLIALVPVARIVTHASEVASRLVLVGLFGVLLLDRLGLAALELPAISQTIFFLEIGLGIALAIRVLRRGGLPGNPRWVRWGARVVLVALAVALLAEIGGWSGLATLVGRGALSLALIAVYVWAAVVAADALLAWVLSSPRWSRFPLAGAEAPAQRRARLFVRWLGAALWLYAALGSVGMRETAVESVRLILDAGISVGALSLTLGGVLAFLLTIVAAPVVARFISFLLEQGVYPRAHLPRGMPYALSTLARYAVYALAFLAALAAAGVELSQLSILIGGLGVGVGLGLQDIVKNFAAGLTLLFERRVHVGDVVQLQSGEIFGRVLAIGMRASLVRNWDGAEVVVPNSDLVSGAVINWTLSDRLRRIELPVGVAYGTDPERVAALLLEVARGHADVIEHPPPQALFQGFGESSLDFLLRVWSDSEYDRTLAIRSELALATHRTLRDAGITIPFPQRDLHLASVSPAVRAAIEGNKGES